MLWLPALRPLVLKLATPLPLIGTLAPSTVELSRNVTVPVGAGVPTLAGVTLAVKVTDCPGVLGEPDVCSAVVVAEMFSRLPTLLVPALPTATSGKPSLFQSPTVRTAGPAVGSVSVGK